MWGVKRRKDIGSSEYGKDCIGKITDPCLLDVLGHFDKGGQFFFHRLNSADYGEVFRFDFQGILLANCGIPEFCKYMFKHFPKLVEKGMRIGKRSSFSFG